MIGFLILLLVIVAVFGGLAVHPLLWLVLLAAVVLLLAPGARRW